MLGRMITIRVRLLAAVAALTLIGVPAALAAEGHPTSYPGGTWQPPAAAFGVSTDSNMSVRMDDGDVLKVDVSYPTDPKTGTRLPGPFPVLLNQDPYTAEPAVGASAPNYFVQHGFIYVHLHDRGTGGPEPGESQGATDLGFGPRLGLDGVEMAYWAADPMNVAGSNGTVGLEGCSALAEIQMSTLDVLGQMEATMGQISVPGHTLDGPRQVVSVTAATNPVKAAIPQCVQTNEYLQQFTDNGVGAPEFGTAFLAPVAGVALFGLNTDTPSSSLTPTAWSTDYLTNGETGYDRRFWQDRDWLLHADDIGRTGVPMLMWDGWQEAGFMGVQPMYAALQNLAAGRPATDPMLAAQKTSPKYQVIVGDWGHGGGLDQGIELEWYQTWMQGIDTGLQSSPGSLMLEEQPGGTTPQWIAPRTYPMTTAYKAVYLGDTGSALEATGTLSTTKSSQGGADQIVWTPGPGAQLTYTSAPVIQDTTLFGPGAADLWVRSSTTNVQLYVELDDVAPGGSTTEITHGSILAARSHLDPARSWTAPNGLPLQPFLTLDADRYITANAAVQLQFPLEQVTWKLLAGHRLRVIVAPNAGIKCAVVTQIASAGAAAALVPIPYGCLVSAPDALSLAGGVFQILHGGDHSSLLNLPLVPSNEIPTIQSGPTPTSGGVALPQQW